MTITTKKNLECENTSLDSHNRKHTVWRKEKEKHIYSCKKFLLLILLWKSLVLALPQAWDMQITSWHVHKRSSIKEMVKLTFILFKICEKYYPVFLPEAKRKGKKKTNQESFYKGCNCCLWWKCVQLCLKIWAAHGVCLGFSNSHGGNHLHYPASSSISIPFGQRLLVATTSVWVLRTVACKGPFWDCWGKVCMCVWKQERPRPRDVVLRKR